MFKELERRGMTVDADAYIIAGPAALKPIAERCAAVECDLIDLAIITEIVRDHPLAPEAVAVLTLLVRQSATSTKARLLAYRAMGAYGDQLAPRLRMLVIEGDSALAAAASAALVALRK